MPAPLPPGDRLNRPARGGHDQHRHQGHGQQDGQGVPGQHRPQLHDSGGAGDEEQGEYGDEKPRRLPHLLQLHQARPQGRQQEGQAVNAGGDGQGEEAVEDLPQEAEGQDAEKLEDVFHGCHLVPAGAPENSFIII